MAFRKDDPEYKQKTSINENRDSPKSTKELVQELEKKSFAQEIEQDKNKSAVLIGRAEKAEESLKDKTSDKDLKQEIESVAVYKRALIMLGSSDMEVNPEKGGMKKGTENGLPISSYLSHGSRSVIQIPPGSNDDLINWLTSGNKETNGMSRAQDPNKAMSEDPPKYVYNRSAATHDVSIKDGKVQEEKGFTIGLKSFLGNKVLGQETKHFGVDLAVDAELGGKDGNGKIVTKPDGDHGHLYIHYTPATKDKPGSIMFGLEGAAPYSSKHSKTGASDPISPTGSSKFDDLDIKKRYSGEPEYNDTVVPKKYNGIYANLDSEKINEITKLNDKNFGIELAEAKPGKSPQDFVDKIQAKDFHKTPELKPTKTLETKEVPKPTRWQNFANKVTLGNAYKKEVAEYKSYKNERDSQVKISSTDEKRVTRQQAQQAEPAMLPQPVLAKYALPAMQQQPSALATEQKQTPPALPPKPVLTTEQKQTPPALPPKPVLTTKQQRTMDKLRSKLENPTTQPVQQKTTRTPGLEKTDIKMGAHKANNKGSGREK